MNEPYLEGGYNGGKFYVTDGKVNGLLCDTPEEAAAAWTAVLLP